MAWRDAIQETPEGCALLVEVTPGASETVFPAGFNPWRGRLLIRVRAPPRDGKANREVARAVARALGLAPSKVAVVAGQSDSRKRVAAAIPRAAAIDRLAGELD